MIITEAVKKIFNTNQFDPKKLYVVVHVPRPSSDEPQHVALNLTPRGQELYLADKDGEFLKRIERVLQGKGTFIQIARDELVTPNGGHYARVGKTIFYSIGLNNRHTFAPKLAK